MQILEVTPEVYQSVIHKPFTIYHRAAFNALNAARCGQVLYLLFRDKMYRLGLIGGIRDQVFYSPFSAPFGGFSGLKPTIQMHYLDEALAALESFLKERNIRQIHFTLPPFRYASTFISQISNALSRQHYELKSSDLNHYFELSRLQNDYIAYLKPSARTHLRKAQKQALTLYKAETLAEKKQAYDIIQHNREIRGNPLHLTWEMIQQTIALVPADFFLLQAPTENVAAAINFYVLPEVVQIVYWGSLPEKNALRPMNLLAMHLFAYYYRQGVEWLDVGASSIHGIPQAGLCHFKESIGCAISLKQTFSKDVG